MNDFSLSSTPYYYTPLFEGNPDTRNNLIKAICLAFDRKPTTSLSFKQGYYETYHKCHYEYYVEPILKRIHEVFGFLCEETKTICSLTKISDGDYDYKVIIELPKHRKSEINNDLKPFVEGDTLRIESAYIKDFIQVLFSDAMTFLKILNARDDTLLRNIPHELFHER
jgi:hypothetical protein